jgi:hypothetical protein
VIAVFQINAVMIGEDIRLASMARGEGNCRITGFSSEKSRKSDGFTGFLKSSSGFRLKKQIAAKG